jgi:hypothetical protein
MGPLIRLSALFAVVQHALRSITVYCYSYITHDQVSELTKSLINGVSYVSTSPLLELSTLSLRFILCLVTVLVSGSDFLICIFPGKYWTLCLTGHRPRLDETE